MTQDNERAKALDDTTDPKTATPAEEQSLAANDFHPIRIKGEPLSETIIRERREGW